MNPDRALNAHPSPPTAIVLAGGHSTRLGRDKALAIVDGVTLLLHVVRALEEITSDIVVVQGRGQARPALLGDCRLRCVEDE